MDRDAWIVFLVLVFGTAFLLSQIFMSSAFGENRQARRRIRQRVAEVASEEDHKAVSLLKQEYLDSLSPAEAWLESLPGMHELRRILQQAGQRSPAYRVLMRCVGFGLLAAVAIAYVSDVILYGVLGGLVLGFTPLLVLFQQRRARLEKFEEQFPEALDTMARAMRAGHPYNLSLKFVADELSPPIADEFGIMFSEVNYGGDHRRSLLNLLERIPSVTVMAFVAAVLIQRESGGNLTDLLSKLAHTVRQRFRFQRNMRTLSAQGRLSAWILSLEPFLLFGILWVVAPQYIQVMLVDPRGHWLLALAFGLVLAGVFWISKVIRIDV
jgi:tight adherence protein B